MPIHEKLLGYDWEHAFQCVGVEPGDTSRYNEPAVSRVLGFDGSAEPFTRQDVAEVIASEAGENDGANWIALMILNDGRFAFLTAGCDYTGWDCWSGGHGLVGGGLDAMVSLALGGDDRARLGEQIESWRAEHATR